MKKNYIKIIVLYLIIAGSFIPANAFDINTNGTVNVLNAIRHSKVKRLIFASTSAVYENNNNNDGNIEIENPYANSSSQNDNVGDSLGQGRN